MPDLGRQEINELCPIYTPRELTWAASTGVAGLVRLRAARLPAGLRHFAVGPLPWLAVWLGLDLVPLAAWFGADVTACSGPCITARHAPGGRSESAGSAGRPSGRPVAGVGMQCRQERARAL